MERSPMLLTWSIVYDLCCGYE